MLGLAQSEGYDTCVTEVSGGNETEILSKAQALFEQKYGLNSQDGKLHVLLVGGDVGGCGYYRIELPGKYLNRTHTISAVCTIKIVPELIQWAHLIVWQRQHKEDLVRIRNLIRDTGRTQIFELDDNLHTVEPSNPAYVFYNPKTKHYHDMKEWIRECGFLSCTRKPLGEWYKKNLGVNYRVLPNSLDFETIPAPQVNDTGRLRIGWAGSSTHYDDLKVALYAIKQLQKEFDFDFVMMGWDGVNRVKTPSGDIIPTSDCLSGVKREYHPFVKVEEYMNKLASLKFDIGICPVNDTVFNSAKSNIKWMEFSSLRIPTVVAGVSCYTDYVEHGRTALVAKKEMDWYRHLKRLIQDAELRKTLATNAYDEVYNNYNMATNVKMWEKLYLDIMKYGKQSV